MGRRNSAVAVAMKNIIRDLPDHLRELPQALKQIGKDVILPMSAFLIAFAIGWHWLYTMYKIMYPPTAEEYHAQALNLLQKRSDTATRQHVKKLLNRSIKQYPKYLPSYLALIAMLLYQEGSLTDGLETIERALEIFPKDHDLLQMKMDAKALQANLGQMVNGGVVASRYLGVAGWRTIIKTH